VQRGRYTLRLSFTYSDLAQLVEQAAVNRRVAGSSPAVGAFLRFHQPESPGG
jgi:hypothetical protein